MAGELSVQRAVSEVIQEVRLRNAQVVAWLRIALRALTLGLYGWAVLHAEALFNAPLFINALHLAAAIAVLVLLRRRWRWREAALGAAVLDVIVVATAGWRAVAAPAPGGVGLSVGYLLAVMELMIAFAAVCLPMRQVAALAGAAAAWQVALALRAGLPPEYVVLSVLTFLAFAFASVWSGQRMVGLAAHLAADAYAARLVLEHRDVLARANAEIAAQRDAVLAAQRQAEVLAQLLVHDMKSPLAAVLQYQALVAEALRGRPGLSEAEADLALAGAEARRLSDMLGDLLLLSRLEAGQLRPSSDPVAIGDLYRAVALTFAARAAERQVALAPACEEDLVALLDRDLMRRLVENLAANALRYCRAGDRVELGAARGGEGLALWVRNTGAPVPGELRTRLFQKHAGSDRREWHNVGLGLYFCRLVAEAHGGAIALVDRPGWSVSFEVALPAAVLSLRGEVAAGGAAR